MQHFIVRRLQFLLVSLVIASLLVFLITRVLPGDVARVLLGREAGPAELAAVRAELGLDDPLPLQYLRWAGRFFTGDWGTSFSRPRQPVRPLVLLRLARSVQLAFISLVLGVPAAIFLGVLAGLSQGRWVDSLITLLVLPVASLPEFVTGLALISVLALRLGWFPATSSIRPDAGPVEALPYLWLPAVTAALVLTAYIVRLTRAGIIEEMKQDYVRTALLKGLPYPTVIFRHVLRNALAPTATAVASSVGWLISGLVVIEFVFSYPGLGRLLVFAIENRDLPLIQAIVMTTTAAIMCANFCADILYVALNPRIKLN